jgi:hypothetical protein
MSISSTLDNLWELQSDNIIQNQKKNPLFLNPKPTLLSPLATPLKIQKLTWDEMDKIQLKGLCYNWDDKYFPEKKCKEQNIVMAMTEDVSHLPEIPPTTDLNPPSYPPKVQPRISLNALTGFSAPQTLKLIDYIKN